MNISSVGMSDQEIIQDLTNFLSSARRYSPFVSLRLWYEGDDNLHFFFTNTPPKKRVTESNIIRMDREDCRRHEISPVLPGRHSSKRKRNSTPQPSPEVLREQCEQDSVHGVTALSSENHRSEVEVSVPCKNTFEILASLDQGDHNGDDQGEGDNNDGNDRDGENDKEPDQIDSTVEEKNKVNNEDCSRRKCYYCENEVPYPWNKWCRECYLTHHCSSP